MEETKLTKKEKYAMLKEAVVSSDAADKDMLVEFIDAQIQAIDNKAAKAKEKAEEKRVAGDELRETIKGLLTEELQTAEQIVEAINDEEITKAKVTARITQLVKLNEVVKEEVTVEDAEGKKVKRMAYKLA